MVLDRPAREGEPGEEQKEWVAVGWVVIDRVRVLAETASAQTAELKHLINGANPVLPEPVRSVVRQ